MTNLQYACAAWVLIAAGLSMVGGRHAPMLCRSAFTMSLIGLTESLMSGGLIAFIIMLEEDLAHEPVE